MMMEKMTKEEFEELTDGVDITSTDRTAMQAELNEIEVVIDGHLNNMIVAMEAGNIHPVKFVSVLLPKIVSLSYHVIPEFLVMDMVQAGKEMAGNNISKLGDNDE